MTGNHPPCRFSTNWFNQSAAHWPALFKAIAWEVNKPSVIVEIGSYEGASACWMLDHLLLHRDSRLYCLDTFKGSIEHAAELRQNLEQQFRHNIALTGKMNQVETLIGRSEDGLITLLARYVAADFVYVDGSHQVADVLTDAVLAWKLLKPGGLLIFDDYLWPKYKNQPLLNPKWQLMPSSIAIWIRFAISPDRSNHNSASSKLLIRLIRRRAEPRTFDKPTRSTHAQHHAAMPSSRRRLDHHDAAVNRTGAGRHFTRGGHRHHARQGWHAAGAGMAAGRKSRTVRLAGRQPADAMVAGPQVRC